MTPIQDANGKPIPPTIPVDALACANCMWARKEPDPSPNYSCWTDPPRVMSVTRPRTLPGMPAEVGFISIRPTVQPDHGCRHFLMRAVEPNGSSLPAGG